MPDKLSIEQFAAEIKKRRPDLAGIPNDTLVGKTLGAAPELKEYVNLDTTMPAPEGILSQLFGHLGVQKSDPATPIAGSSPTGAPIINPMQPSVASEGAAQSLVGMGQAIKSAPGATLDGVKAALTGKVGPLVSGLIGQGRQILGPMVSQPEPGSPEWQQAQRGAGASLIAAEAPNAISGALSGSSRLAQAVADMAPSKVRAGADFQTIYSKMGKTPATLAGVDDAALNAMELSGGRLGGRVVGTGYTAPKVLSDYIAQRASAPTMDFETARQFQTSAGRLSAAEQMATKGPMKAKIAELAKALSESNRADAVKGGMGDLYDSAMKEYRQAARIGDYSDALVSALKNRAVQTGLGTGLGYGLYRSVTGNQ